MATSCKDSIAKRPAVTSTVGAFCCADTEKESALALQGRKAHAAINDLFGAKRVSTSSQVRQLRAHAHAVVHTDAHEFIVKSETVISFHRVGLMARHVKAIRTVLRVSPQRKRAMNCVTKWGTGQNHVFRR
jgi:hypothetical protein